MGLQRYWQKRDFTITPEPRGELAGSQAGMAFFIQRHHARRLHYDFRLELDGSLKSWAVPKGPSLDPAHKRLAVHVEDHPLSYGSFEGEIPAHQYGAGKVVLWDRGWWEPLTDPMAGYRQGSLKFRLHGVKLHGTWALVRMHGRDDDQDNWLLIKEHDDMARSGAQADITALQPGSVAGRAMPALPASSIANAPQLEDQGATHPAKKAKASQPLAGTQPRTAATSAGKPTAPASSRTKSKASAKADVPASASTTRTTRKPGKASKLPALLSPQLATLAAAAPSGDDWLCEVKFDGYRALARIEHGECRLYSRNGNDWSAKWASIASAAAALPLRQAWLDGEMVAVDSHGNISFQALQHLARHDTPAQLRYYVFDLLHLDGRDLSGLPLLRRKQLLQALLASLGSDSLVQYSDHIQGDADEVFRHACLHGMEGIIAKRAQAPYRAERNRDWLKLKCGQRQEFVIGGYTDPQGTRSEFGALLLGYYRDGELHYAGRVGTGFDQASLAAIARRFAKLQRHQPAYVDPPRGREAVGVHWLQPRLVAEVEFAQWTEAGMVRHASFIALRQDKPASAIVREQALDVVAKDSDVEDADAAPACGSARGRAKAAKPQMPAAALPDAGDQVAGVKLSHPAKQLFPASGITKLALARYYDSVQALLLPHLRQRPLTIVRCPNGEGAKCFFQKHHSATVSDDIARVQVPGQPDGEYYMLANDVRAVVALVQMGVLELHTWGARQPKLTQPDRLIFDLDPADGVPWQQVTEAALLVRGLLEEIGLKSWVKTTGGKGLHVVAPLQPTHDWDVVKAFSKAFAGHLAAQIPQRFTANMAMRQRTGKIYIDYLRNAAGATAVAAYSTRARPAAPISVPLHWDEVGSDIHADTFTIANIHARLDGLKQDPWHDYFSCRQRLSARMLASFDKAG